MVQHCTKQRSAVADLAHVWDYSGHKLSNKSYYWWLKPETHPFLVISRITHFFRNDCLKGDEFERIHTVLQPEAQNEWDESNDWITFPHYLKTWTRLVSLSEIFLLYSSTLKKQLSQNHVWCNSLPLRSISDPENNPCTAHTFSIHIQLCKRMKNDVWLKINQRWHARM